jgi:hypothetical protein
MRRQALQLLANRHNTDWIAWSGGATNRLIESLLVRRNLGRLPITEEEALTELIPGLEDGIALLRESVRRTMWKGGLDSIHPVQGDLLPECDVPQLLIDGVGSAIQKSMSEVAGNTFKDVGWGRGGAIADDSLD